MYQAINQLSEVEKAVILLYLEGYEYKEISAIVGLSETNIGVKIRRYGFYQRINLLDSKATQ